MLWLISICAACANTIFPLYEQREKEKKMQMDKKNLMLANTC